MYYFSRLILVLLIVFSHFCNADFKEGGQAYMAGDYEKAAAEFAPLAKRGDHRAMYALGAMYAAGHGVEKNLKKAFELFSEAAKNGRADAIYKLGLMYETGQATEVNMKKAAKYYQKSAKKGYPLAQYRLGLMYKNGNGIKQNPVSAYAWLVIAGHYFIYHSSNINKKVQSQLLLYQQKEKDKLFGEIIKDLQTIKADMSAEDIEVTKNKVIKLSKYRLKYHSDKIKNLKLAPEIESLFLLELIY